MSCELKTLRVYRGYPTLFNGHHWLSVSFNSEITITGWGAKFVLDNITKTYQNVQSGFYVDLTAQETAGLKNGLLNGTLILIDTDGHEHPFATDIPVMSSDWVDGAMELDNFDLTVNVEIQENELEIKIKSATISQEIIDLINSKQPLLTSANAGDGISITGTGSSVVISNTQTSAEWGNITGDIADQSDLQEALDGKLDKNNDIVGGTHTKITYDEKGLVTNGSDLVASDIPDLSATYYLATNPAGYQNATQVNTAITSYHDSSKVDANASITGGTKCKITYDSKGLVTAGENLSASDIPDLSGTYYTTNNPSGYISGITSLMVTTALGYTPYNSTNPNGYISGITGSMVTTALGYTPYNSTNPNGYQTSAQVGTAITNSIVNNVTSSSTTNSLSANMGKALQDQITNLKGIGRFLALWNCATGLAESNPTVSPRPYNTGDYFVVGTVAAVGGTNYKPNGSEYITGQASTTVETASVAENDVYFYDGTNWTLQNNHGGLSTVSFSNITGQPTDNTNLATALSGKVSGNTAITGATKCKITYDSKGLVTGGANLTTSDIPDLSGTYYLATNPSGYINGITGTMVTSALGYTPYNSTNPSGYQTASQVSTSISAYHDSTKVNANTAITGATKTKITYDSKGLVTGGSDLTSSDITGALGYTPYNSTNPSGYITSSDVGNGTITITQGGTTKGTFTTNQSGNTTIALDAGGGSYTAGTGISITNNVISNTGLINTATGDNSISIAGRASEKRGSINIGYLSNANYDGAIVIGYGSSSASPSIVIGNSTNAQGGLNIAIGSDSTAFEYYSVAIGYGSETRGKGSIQLGHGTNSTAGTFSVGLSTNGSTWNNYQLLDSSGKIPNARLTISTTMSSSSTDSEIPSTKLLYDTVGNIEALLAAI